MSFIRQNKRLRLRGVFASILFLSSLAASAAMPNWQGSYVGVYTGGAIGVNQLSTNVGSVTSSSYFQNNADINAVNGSGTSSNYPTTIIGGFVAGQDWAVRQAVYGAVLDLTSLSLSSSQNVTANYPGSSDQYTEATSMNTTWLFTLRGRIGYATTFNKVPSLFYVTAGPALTQINVTNSFRDTSASSGTGGTSASEYKIGWSAGLGFELLTFNHISIDAEYLHVQFPSMSTGNNIYNLQGGFGPGFLTSPFTTTGRLSVNLFKIGMNYRF
jgi:opacity protein-like surface antigen